MVRLSCTFGLPRAPSDQIPTAADVQESDMHCEGVLYTDVNGLSNKIYAE